LLSVSAHYFIMLSFMNPFPAHKRTRLEWDADDAPCSKRFLSESLANQIYNLNLRDKKLKAADNVSMDNPTIADVPTPKLMDEDRITITKPLPGERAKKSPVVPRALLPAE